MNQVGASFLAMVASWALPLVGTAAGQLATSGRIADLGVMALWVGLFSLIGWAAIVLPVVTRFGRKKLVSDIRWAWLGWSILGAVSFSILLIPIMGKEALLIIWYPSMMGCIAGVVFALLVRKRNGKPA